MSGSYFTEAFIFIVRTGFDLYLLAIVLRFLLQIVGADSHNPVSQLLIRITTPVLKYFWKVIPRYKGLDWSPIVLGTLIKVVEITILHIILGSKVPTLQGLIVLSVAEILHLIVYIFIIAIFIQVILSWVNPGAYNPVTTLLYRLTEPLLRPARKLLPPMGGLDLSPIIAFFFLQLTIILVTNPLMHLGRLLS